MFFPLIILSAFLTSLSFHPIGLHFFAWFSLVPLLFAFENKKPSQAFKSGILFGWFFSLFSLFWIVFLQIETNIKLLMIFGMVLMFLYIGLYFGVAFLFASRIGIWSLPFAIAGLEFLKGLGELGFPWLSLGYSQARYPLFIQQASIYGVYGVSFWLVLVNIALYLVLRKRTLKYLILTMLFFFIPLLYGFAALNLESAPPTAKKITVGVIQPNIDPNLKFTTAMREESISRLFTLSKECQERAAEEKQDSLDLIIWPETAVPFFIKSSNEYRTLISQLCTEIGAPIFTGAPIFNYKTREVHNGAVLIMPNVGIADEYIKIHLVPFGEHIPFDRYIPLFRKIDFGEGDYAPGFEYTVLNAGGLKFSCLVCFESIFPELSREFVRRGAQLLVNITNDGWFGKISGPQQHNDMAILRTVENGVALARSANTGISMVVDHKGRVIKETGLFEEGFLACTVSIGHAKTLYGHIGDLLPILSLVMIPVFYIYQFFRKVRKDKT